MYRFKYLFDYKMKLRASVNRLTERAILQSSEDWKVRSKKGVEKKKKIQDDIIRRHISYPHLGLRIKCERQIKCRQNIDWQGSLYHCNFSVKKCTTDKGKEIQIQGMPSSSLTNYKSTAEI